MVADVYICLNVLFYTYAVICSNNIVSALYKIKFNLDIMKEDYRVRVLVLFLTQFLLVIDYKIWRCFTFLKGYHWNT